MNAGAETITPGIDSERLWGTVEELAGIGATASGGVRRIALTGEDAAGRERVARWALEAGCTARTDAIGNVFFRRPGGDPSAPAVMIGSHLDTQPDGGRFDGALGVLSGLEVLRTLEDHRAELRAPVELAVWTDEEGARFDVSCIGSSVFSGELAISDAYALRDDEGISLREALERQGLRGEHPAGEPRPAAYFELHIEQGPVLEQAGVALGVVEGITGIRWIQVTFTGASRHAGTTPWIAAETRSWERPRS